MVILWGWLFPMSEVPLYYCAGCAAAVPPVNNDHADFCEGGDVCPAAGRSASC